MIQKVSSYTQAQKIRMLVCAMFDSVGDILPEGYYNTTHRVLLRKYASCPPLPDAYTLRVLVTRWSENTALSNLAIQEFAEILKDAKAIYDENNYSI